jgi:hypothetical protein
LENHPARAGIFATGILSKVGATVPGTPAYDFHQRLAQLKSDAFLNAYGTLRGAGAISDAEGKKAETAIGRLQAGLSSKDFNAALKDFREVTQQALVNVQKIARGEMQPYAVDTPASSAAQPPAGFKQAPNGKWYSEKPGTNGKYQIWTP